MQHPISTASRKLGNPRLRQRPQSGATPLFSLRDAAHFIRALSKAGQWQTATELLILIAEHGGDSTRARVGVMRALRRHQPKAAAHRKRAKAFRIAR